MALRRESLKRGAAAVAVVLAVVTVSAALPRSAQARPSGDVVGVGALLASPESSLQELQSEARSVRASMERLEAEMVALTEEWHAAQRHLEETNAQLTAARRQLAHSRTELERQRRLVAVRMVTMYKTADHDSWFDIVAGASSLAEAQVVLDVMRRISELDRHEEDELERLTVEAWRLEGKVEEDRETAIAVEIDVDAQRAAMDQKIAEREALLKDVVAQIKKILASPELLMKAGGKVTQVSWAQAFLKSLNMRQTVDNLAAIIAWEMAEGGHWYNTAYYNPLNTSQPMPGAKTFNSHGVKIFTSWTQGLKASVITINNGFYGGILAALRAGNDGQVVAAAVAASPWGTGLFTVRE